jgi:hypothetical protein
VEAAPEAGALLQAVRSEQLPELEAFPPDLQLEVVARKAALIATVVPSLARRVGSLVRRLRRTAPAASLLAPAHGDFHARQLVRVAGSLVVLDLDAMCLAAPAFDLAEYAAGAIDESGADADAGAAVLERLVEGCDARPEALDWHLAAAILVRASHPFHRWLPAWPERLEDIVGMAERVVPRGGLEPR